MDRLRRRGLGHLALDLHGAGVTRKSVMKQFGESLAAVHDSMLVDAEELHRRFVEKRNQLNIYVGKLHEKREPSGLSAYQMQGRLLHFSGDGGPMTRWRGDQLRKHTRSVMDEARNLLVQLAGFRSLFFGDDPSPWARAKLDKED